MTEIANRGPKHHLTRLKMLKLQMISLPKPFKSACGEKNLEPAFKIYSEYACLVDCYTRMAVNACNCRMLSMPSIGKWNVCFVIYHTGSYSIRERNNFLALKETDRRQSQVKTNFLRCGLIGNMVKHMV